MVSVPMITKSGRQRSQRRALQPPMLRAPAQPSRLEVPRPQFIVLCAFLVAAFAMGGSARGDIQSLMILRPVSAITLGYGLTSLNWGHLKAHRWILGFAAALIVLPIAQLVPLPASVSYALPGHSLIADIDQASGNYGVARPISLAPSQTRNALWSMMAPSRCSSSVSNCPSVSTKNC